MGLLERGQAMVNRRHRLTESVLVEYTRKTADGTTRTVTVPARRGRTVFSGLADEAVTVQWGELDFLIEVADLALEGVPTTPMRGDRLALAGQVFEAASPQNEEPAWRYSDQFRTVYRIHVQRVA